MDTVFILQNHIKGIEKVYTEYIILITENDTRSFLKLIQSTLNSLAWF
jgi:hypothetical protein